MSGNVTVRAINRGMGPDAQYFAEPIGCSVVVGQQRITVEESEPGAFLRSAMEQEVVLVDALPGVWRTNLACVDSTDAL